jgi:hypothetical protein
MQQRDRRWAVGPFFEGEGAEVAVHWPPLPPAPMLLWAMRRQRRVPQPPPLLSTRVSRAKRSGQSSIGYRRRRLRGCKTRGGGFTQGRAGASRYEGGVRSRGIRRGEGARSRCASSRRGEREPRAGPAGPKRAGMREGRDARAWQGRAGMHKGGLRP